MSKSSMAGGWVMVVLVARDARRRCRLVGRWIELHVLRWYRKQYRYSPTTVDLVYHGLARWRETVLEVFRGVSLADEGRWEQPVFDDDRWVLAEQPGAVDRCGGMGEDGL